MVDASFGDLQRTHLDEDSWVDHAPLWMSGSERAFEELLADVAWSQRRRWVYDREVDEPRLTSWQRIGQESTAACQWLEDARVVLSDALRRPLRLGGDQSVPRRRRQRRLAPRPHSRRDRRSHCGPRITRGTAHLPAASARRRKVARIQARSWRPPRYRWPDAAPLRAQRSEGEVGGSSDERRLQTRGGLTRRGVSGHPGTSEACFHPAASVRPPLPLRLERPSRPGRPLAWAAPAHLQRRLIRFEAPPKRGFPYFEAVVTISRRSDAVSC